MFDIKKLNQSSFRGVLFYTRDDELSGGQRLTDHSFINGGTLTESNGLKNNTFKVSGYIGGANYLDQKQALKQAFEDTTSGLLVDKFHGRVEVYVDTWSIKESISKIGMAEVEVSFKKATNKLKKTKEILYTVDVRPLAIVNFKNSFNPAIGDLLRSSIVDDITNMWEKVQDGIKFLEDIRDFSQNIKSKVGNVIGTVKGDIISVVSLSNEIVSIWSSFDEVTNLNLFSATSQKNYTSSLREMAEANSARTSKNYAQAKAIEQSKAYQNCVIAGMVHTAIKNLEYVPFTTGDDFGSVKDDILKVMELLENDIINSGDINDTVAKQDLLNKYHESKKEFITFYTAKFSKLQTLQTDTLTLTTDVFQYTMNKYNDISRVDEVLDNNSIVNPIFISGDVVVLAR